ncbi:MAG TPA: threonine--tRNA ligase [Actinomycetota bacterium]|jgi:threonyl-tRNA synthetase|nr:threonine--tRNA ligase [Actinomycetota bacterium]
MPSLTLPEDVVVELPEGEPVGAALPKGTIAARVDGELRDLSYVPATDVHVEPVTPRSDDGLQVLRHSTAHVMAQAVCDLYPGARYAIGPATTDGFHYDFELPEPVHASDLSKIDRRMRQIVKRRQPFVREEVSRDEAIERLRDQPFKVEILQDIGAGGGDETAGEVGAGETVSLYSNDGWVDLCTGPHVPHTGVLGAFKLTNVAGAYWRGDEANPQLTRIYGTAWASQDDLEAYLQRLEEAERRDHRKLGQDLDLFSFPEEIGSGLAVFHPKGGLVRRLMEDYSRRRHEEAGYEFVYTPHITKSELFEISGHLTWFADGMFPPMELDGGTQYYLKPMNCPMHILIFRSRTRSYRELPLRLFEFGTVYRYELSGVVHGLTRVRGLTMDDAHIFTTPEQLGEELRSVLTFVLDLLRDYGLDDFYMELSTKPEDKAVGADEEWEVATENLRQAAEAMDVPLVMDPGGGAFYGPKISVQARDAIGRTWQMSTIQVDLQFPQRFDLEYSGDDNARHRPVMIHRALFGSVERFFGILTEHYAGAFPLWLSPEQLRFVPVADRHVAHCEELAAKARAAGLRASVDDSKESVGKKIRAAQLAKAPYTIVVGDQEAETDAYTVRDRAGTAHEGVTFDRVIDALVDEASSRSLERSDFGSA